MNHLGKWYCNTDLEKYDIIRLIINFNTVINDIDKLGLNTLNIAVVVNISSITASDMSIDDYSKKQAVTLIKRLKDKGINIILGPPPTDKASIELWFPYQTNKANGLEQANCFQAYKRVFEKESWNLGFSIFAIGNINEDNHYYPSEASNEVIRGWYLK